MEKVIKVNGLRYDLLAQHRDISKVEQLIDKYLKQKFSIHIIKHNGMWLLYGRKEAI